MVTNEKTEADNMENHGKKTKVTVDNKVVELQEDRCLFARMMMVCKSRPAMNIAKAGGVYECFLYCHNIFLLYEECINECY